MVTFYNFLTNVAMVDGLSLGIDHQCEINLEIRNRER